MTTPKPRHATVPTPTGVELRPAAPDDVPILAALFARSVETLAAGRYDAAARRAWAAFAQEATFSDFVLGPETLVAVCDGAVAGFAGLTAGGHIESLYVAPEAAGRGVARRLLEALLARARVAGHERVTTDASAVARPVFERAGFRAVFEERVERGGVMLVRYRMESALGVGEPD